MSRTTTARDVLPRGPVPRLSSYAFVADAVELMREEDVSAVLVGDVGLSGIFTGRDLVTRVAAPGLNPHTTPLGTAMTPAPESVGADDPVAYIIERMAAGGFRHVPVVEEGQPVGLVSVRDLMAHTARVFRTGQGATWMIDELLDANVSQVAETPLVSFDISASLDEVFESMCAPRQTAVMLTRDGALAGILTERDIVKRVDLSVPRHSVEHYMTSEPVVATPGLPLAAAFGLMYSGRFRHLPVVDQSRTRALHLLSITDIVSHLAGRAPARFLNLPPAPHLAAYTKWGG